MNTAVEPAIRERVLAGTVARLARNVYGCLRACLGALQQSSAGCFGVSRKRVRRVVTEALPVLKSGVASR